jgi:murein DD-endopeptidase MepM/ murein hydrolase activator NlpD
VTLPKKLESHLEVVNFAISSAFWGILGAMARPAWRKCTLLAVIVVMATAESAFAEPLRVFPIEQSEKCAVKFARYHHDYPATDIITNKGCAFLAPIDGVVDEVSRRDRWSGKSNRGADRGGLFVSIIGVDGVRYYGSHLSRVVDDIAPGVEVRAGEKLGEVGTSGSARGTAPHLHFGLSWPTEKGDWKIRRGAVLPYKYLKSWQKGGNLSSVGAIKKIAPATR